MKFGCHQVPTLFQVVSVWTPLPLFECHRFITITCQPGKGKGPKAITQSFCAVRVISLCWFTEFSLSKLSEGWNAARYPRSCWTVNWSEMLEAGGTEMTRHTGAQLWQVLHNSGILGKSSRWIKWMWTRQEEAAGAEQWFWTGYKVDRHCGISDRPCKLWLQPQIKGQSSNEHGVERITSTYHWFYAHQLPCFLREQYCC